MFGHGGVHELGLRLSSVAHALVDNTAQSRSRGGRPSRTLSADEYEEWAVRFLHDLGEERLSRARSRAREIAGDFGAEQHQRSTILAAARSRRPVTDPSRTAALPLFEAHFSNFIEGTEFTVDEAVGIVRRNDIPENRPRDGLDTPFARAAFMLFAVSEVHPFDDGNGRVARIMMNAELHAAGEHRILVPIVYREEYLNGLRRLSRQGDPGLLVDVLDYAWQWTSQVDWTDDDTAIRWEC